LCIAHAAHAAPLLLLLLLLLQVCERTAAEKMEPLGGNP
jgi:hypothetical protein